VRAEAARVNDPLPDAFVIEMEDLFSKMGILERRGSARTYAQGILIIGNRHALL